MKKYFQSVFTILLAAAGVFGQDVAPRPSPTPPVDSDVVKISTNLIQIDVSVTDVKGKVITDLKPEEIEIFENGQKQKITNFSFISSVRTTIEKHTAADKADKNAVPVPPTILRPEQIRRTIALVVDDLSLSFESAYQTRRALKKFVDEQMQDGDLVAIVRTGAGIGALQQFTSDKRILYAAIERVKWNPAGSGGISAFALIEPTPLENQKAAGGAVSDEDLQDEKNRTNAFNDFQGSVFATGTLGALKYVIGGMSELPGRKSIILFSDGFRLTERSENGFSGSGRVIDYLTQLIDVASRSSVVIYTIDPRGLQYTGPTAADQIGPSPDAVQKAISDRSDQLFETQSGLSYLARETGGFDIKNNNDISGGVRKILDDQSYYLVAYEPNPETFDPAKRKFNKLEVKVTRANAKVRTRSGFINFASRKTEAAAPIKQTPAGQLAQALTSPFAVNSISLRLNALFGNDAKIGSFVRSLLHIDASGLKFVDQPDGSKKAEFIVLAASFGDNGQPVDQLGRSYVLTVRGETYKKVMTDGFVYQFSFPVKKPGAYQYRVAIRDAATARIGAASQFVEVPNVKKNNLTLSSIVLESLTEEQWKQMSNGTPVSTDPMNDSALRRIKVGTVLRYGFEVFGARMDGSSKTNLLKRVRVFRDGKLILDGRSSPVGTDGQKDLQRIKESGAISIGEKMNPGDYILQIIITDTLASAKKQIATQFVQFEVVE